MSEVTLYPNTLRPRKTFDHPLFLITYPEHGPLYGDVEGQRARNLLSLSLSPLYHPPSTEGFARTV